MVESSCSLAGDLGPIPSSYMVFHNHLAQEDLMPFSDFFWYQACTWYTNIPASKMSMCGCAGGFRSQKQVNLYDFDTGLLQLQAESSLQPYCITLNKHIKSWRHSRTFFVTYTEVRDIIMSSRAVETFLRDGPLKIFELDMVPHLQPHPQGG